MRGQGQVWRALQQARAMNLAHDGAPPAGAGTDGVTRRRVLAALAGLGGAALLPRWPAFAQGSPRIAIIGGGLAGLGALDRLHSLGTEAVLYEARAAAGGRTRSVRGVFADPYAFDEGAQLVNTDHEDVLRMVRRFRLRLVDRRAFGPSHEIQIGRSGRSVREAALAQQLRGIAAQITADADRLDRDYAAVAAEIDRMSVKDYLDRHRLAAGDARDALEATIRTEYGAEPHEASALELLFNLPTVDGQRVNRLPNSDERYLVSGGTDQIAHALAAEHASRIRLGKRLTGLDMSGPTVGLDFADGSHAVAGRVILALPVSLLAELRIGGPLPSLWRSAFHEVRLGRNEKVIVGYDRQSWRPHMGFGGAVWAAGPYSAIWDAVSLAPSAPASPGALCFFLGGGQVDAAAGTSSAELAAVFTSSARRVLPGLPAPNGRVRRTRWGDDPLTRGAYSNFRPGQYARFGELLTIEEEGEVRPSSAGPLLFAGEWLSDKWPGYMNGALQTGRIAAEAALAPARAEAA